MEIENKFNDDRFKIIEKKPNIGDLVTVKPPTHHDYWALHRVNDEIGLIQNTWNSDLQGDPCEETALVYWLSTEDEEEYYINELLNIELKTEKN
tara:strand:+ start:2837 stop:3118 length:282 start_codon:yes stop_codon:yes gene_type:complete